MGRRKAQGAVARATRRTPSLALLIVLVCMPVVLSSSAVAGGEIAGKSCPPISVRGAYGTFTYTVRVEAGNVRCGLARSVLRDAAAWPLDEIAAAADWRCSVGGVSDSWAISCAYRAAIVRAYGPVREQNPWVIAAVRLSVPVLAPTSTFGLALRAVRVRACDDGHKYLTADYARADGATLTIAEGKRYACGDLGVEPVLTSWQVHGRPAKLIEYCFPTGCAKLSGDYALEWCERGIQIIMFTHRIRQRELLTIARSMTLVPA